MDIYICVHPADVRTAEQTGFPLCHMAYRIGKGFRLYRSGLGISVNGGILCLNDLDFDSSSNYSDLLIRDIRRECSMRGFSGVMLDFELPPHDPLLQFVREADEYFDNIGIPLYIPESYANAAHASHICSSTAVTGGSFAESCRSLYARYGNRAALQYEPACIDFELPSPKGISDRTTSAELKEIMLREHVVPYFSSELCANYFTYRKDGKSRFALFDDSRSLVRKLETAKHKGIKTAFICLPDVGDTFQDLKRL